MDEVIIVYADILFLIDFIMDFLCLYITVSLMSAKIKLWRITVSSALGGVYAVSLQYLPETKLLYFLPLHIFAAFMMVLTACGFSSFRRLASRALVFILTSAFLGGILTAIFSFRGGVVVNGGRAYAEISPFLLITVALLSVVSAYVYGVICRKKLSQSAAHAEITVGSRKLNLSLLVDTGCHVVDPITGEGVIIVSSRVFGSEKPPMTRVIPIKSAGGVKILEAFRPEDVKVNGVSVNAVIASDELNTDYSGCDGLIPTILLR